MLLRSPLTSAALFRNRGINLLNLTASQPKIVKRWNSLERHKDGSIKFTRSGAHIDYKATENFYSNDKSLPKSHNIVLASSFISGLFYLFFLRDDIDGDGGKALLKPIHETVPELAIPLIRAAIAENKRYGADTSKLEKKLAEYLNEPDKYGGEHRKLIEN